MNIEELAMQDLKIKIYGVAITGIALKVDKDSPFDGLTPVLVKGWGWKELCIAARERRVLLLSGTGEAPVGCGWLAPVKMWTVDRADRSIALDVQAGTIEHLLEVGASIQPSSLGPQKERKATESPAPIDEEIARRFEQFLSDESLFKTSTWVAHNANNEL